MSGGLAGFARRWWRGDLGLSGRILSGLAVPLSWAWSAAAGLTRSRRERRAVAVEGVTVVSVGNLAVGGTGKTPFVGWLGRTLLESGERPAVLVGGAAHDEATLLAERLEGVPVVQNRDRVTGARSARSAGSSVVILDDGFQHRQIRRDLDVVLLAAEDPFPGPVLPCGPYREPPGRLSRADVVLVTRRVASAEAGRELKRRAEAYAPGRVLGGVELALTHWRTLDGQPAEPPTGDVIAVCSIARPHAFRRAVDVRVQGSVELVAFTDHHDYTPGDVERLAALALGRPLVITEKDAVKLREHAGTLDDVRVLCEEVLWEWGEGAFRERLRAVCSTGVGP